MSFQIHVQNFVRSKFFISASYGALMEEDRRRMVIGHQNQWRHGSSVSSAEAMSFQTCIKINKHCVMILLFHCASLWLQFHFSSWQVWIDMAAYKILCFLHLSQWCRRSFVLQLFFDWDSCKTSRILMKSKIQYSWYVTRVCLQVLKTFKTFTRICIFSSSHNMNSEKKPGCCSVCDLPRFYVYFLPILQFSAPQNFSKDTSDQ